MSKVLIMMSTYNGEKYIREQIQSILSQKGEDISILVRDDGSIDNTTQILDQYANEGKLTWYSGENLKPAKSFMNLVYTSDFSAYDYFAFSDQDDVWLTDKVHTAVASLNNVKGPAMYYCKTDNVTAELKHIDYFFRDSKYSTSLQTSLFTGSLIPGCTIMFNRALMNELRHYCPSFITMHDNWVHLVCLATGGAVIADDTAHILYRQHGNNAVGSARKGLHYRLKRMLGKKRVFSGIARELYLGYEEKMKPNEKKAVFLLANYRKSVRLKLEAMFLCQHVLHGKKDRILSEIKILLGTF